MILSNKQAYGIVNTGALKALDDCKLSPKTKWNILRASKQIDTNLSDLEAFRTELIKKLGKADEDGTFTILDENRQQFADQMGEVLDETFEVHAFTLDLDTLEGLSFAQLDALTPFINTEDNK